MAVGSVASYFEVHQREGHFWIHTFGFHSNDWIHTAVTKLALKNTIIPTASMAISFFAPGEGKNLCDGHFGVLSRVMSVWIQNGNILERDPTPLVQMFERDVERTTCFELTKNLLAQRRSVEHHAIPQKHVIPNVRLFSRVWVV